MVQSPEEVLFDAGAAAAGGCEEVVGDDGRGDEAAGLFVSAHAASSNASATIIKRESERELRNLLGDIAASVKRGSGYVRSCEEPPHAQSGPVQASTEGQDKSLSTIYNTHHNKPRDSCKIRV